MKTNLCLLLLFACTSCYIYQPFDKNEVEQNQSSSYELLLEASYELNDLRLDIIRQTYEEQVNDSTTETHNVAYHPVGFNLGNGLFYDLNRNLSLRTDYLLSIEELEDYSIKRVDFRGNFKDITTYRAKNADEICKKWNDLFGEERSHCTTVKSDERTVEVYHRGNLCYALSREESQSTFSRGNNRRLEYTIIKKEDDNYMVKLRKRDRAFVKQGNTITLDNQYIVTFNEADNSIHICLKGRKRDILLYRLVKSDKEMYVLNPRYYGYKFELNGDELVVSNSWTMLFQLIKQ